MTVADANTTAGSASSSLPLTPAEIEGPYFRLGAPRRDSLRGTVVEEAAARELARL